LDDECSDWYKEVMRDLRDIVWKLKKESNMAIADEVVADSTMEHVDEVQEMNILLQKELLKKIAELDGKEKELKDMEAKMKKKNWWLKMALCLCVVLGLVILFLTSNVPLLAM
jgi:biopolymer transport protein ExbB/TolQ